jgi:hypothetical protein
VPLVTVVTWLPSGEQALWLMRGYRSRCLLHIPAGSCAAPQCLVNHRLVGTAQADLLCRWEAVHNTQRMHAPRRSKHNHVHVVSHSTLPAALCTALPTPSHAY